MQRRSQRRLEALAQVSDVARFVEEKGLESEPPRKRARRTPSKTRWVAPAAAPPTEWVDVAEAGEQKVLTSVKNRAGYYGVCRMSKAHTRTKPYQAQVRRNGRHVYLGAYKTAEEAAAAVTASAEGRNAAFLASVRAGVQVPGSAFSITPEPTPTPEECSDAHFEHAKGGTAAWWTEEEDRRLLYAAYLVGSWNQPTRGSGKWEQVARLVGTRNTRQCRRRWSTAHNAALVSAHNGEKPGWPPEPRPRKPMSAAQKMAAIKRRRAQKEELVADAAVSGDGFLDEEAIGNFLADADDGRDAEEAVEQGLTFDVPDFMNDTNRSDIYDHYGLMAIETLPEHDTVPTTDSPTMVRRIVVGEQFKGSFEFKSAPAAKRQLVGRFAEEAAIRNHQATITDFMLATYKRT